MSALSSQDPTSRECSCIYADHCHRSGGCKLLRGGSVNTGGGVCSPPTPPKER